MFGEIIKKHRKLNGYTQKSLAQFITNNYKPIVHSSISAWEKNKSKPDADMLVYLCNILDIDLNLFVENYKKENVPKEKIEVYKDGQFKAELEFPKGESPTVDQVQEAIDHLHELKNELKRKSNNQ